MVTQEAPIELTVAERSALGEKIERFARTQLSPAEQRFLEDALKHAGLWLFLDTSLREDDPVWWSG